MDVLFFFPSSMANVSFILFLLKKKKKKVIL